MPRPSDARSRLIRVSAALFRQRGYDGVGLTEILEASGAPKGSFYHHFPGGKEQLAEETIRYAGEQMGDTIDRVMSSADDFSLGVKRLANGLADWFERSRYSEGCPITSVALATAPRSERHTIAISAVFADWQKRVANHAQRFGVPEFSDADAERLLMLIEGAWILARAQQSKAPLLRAADAFVVSLRR